MSAFERTLKLIRSIDDDASRIVSYRIVVLTRNRKQRRDSLSAQSWTFVASIHILGLKYVWKLQLFRGLGWLEIFLMGWVEIR